ncbi:5-formyltetrahydrofolate cyclo-ligase [Pedobacter sp. UYP30]|uniref:5-formyltetrahydrofolate cyclo-ligase n=1 Tax=Pedobacter sp. UYP30 TaxID=1756400 RepID=UPI003395522B
MLKKQIRLAAMAQRSALSEDELNLSNQKLLHHFSTLDFSGVNTLHIFLPILEKREPNTFLLIEWLKLHHTSIKVVVPKADFNTSLMSQHEYLGKGDIKKNLYNILEPQKSLRHDGEIDMVIVPLLAFDSRGNRVGYGKGFYDRFLQNTKAKKIGLSLTNLPVEINDLQGEDIALDACITPNGIINFS